MKKTIDISKIKVKFGGKNEPKDCFELGSYKFLVRFGL